MNIYTENELVGLSPLSSGQQIFRILPSFEPHRDPEQQYNLIIRELDNIRRRIMGSAFHVLSYPELTDKVKEYFNFKEEPFSWLILKEEIISIEHLPNWVVATDKNNSPNIFYIRDLTIIIAY